MCRIFKESLAPIPCITHSSTPVDTGVPHIYYRHMNYMCITPKTPHIYYTCVTYMQYTCGIFASIWYQWDPLYMIHNTTFVSRQFIQI